MGKSPECHDGDQSGCQQTHRCCGNASRSGRGCTSHVAVKTIHSEEEEEEDDEDEDEKAGAYAEEEEKPLAKKRAKIVDDQSTAAEVNNNTPSQS